ncbi:MAG TPA: hypothetical protein VK841_12720 [Polyangiaceae bacterium]|jgi:hypothetical protein|nr:hypothetical protein [Polyangiaceae bacterium]
MWRKCDVPAVERRRLRGDGCDRIDLGRLRSSRGARRFGSRAVHWKLPRVRSGHDLQRLGIDESRRFRIGGNDATGDPGPGSQPGNPVDASTPDSSDPVVCDQFNPEVCTESFTVGPAGGTVTDGDLSLTIPPGALPGDTVISVTNEPWDTPLNWAECSPMYSFGPSSVALAVPATIQFSGVTQQSLYPAAIPLVVADPESAEVRPLPTTATTNTISASVTELSSVACVAISAIGDAQAPGAAAPGVPAASGPQIAPCGGDPTGSWMLTDEYFTIPYEADSRCSGATFSLGQTAGNEIISLASGMYTVMAFPGATAGEHALTVPMSCFDGHEDAGADCFNVPYDLYTGLYPSPLTFNGIASDSLCGFEGPATFDGETSTSGSYSLSGSTIVAIPGAASTARGSNEYCIQGDTSLQSLPSDATNAVFVLSRLTE